MKSCSLVLACSLVIGAVPSLRAAAVPAVTQDALHYAEAGSVQLQGHLGEEMALSIRHRILAQNLKEVVDPFRVRADKTEWRSEFWGKWITSAILAYRFDRDPALREKISTAVRELISTQTPDGYIGAYAPENRLQRWDIWGRKYVLLGLLAWYDASGDAAALAAARKEADFTLTEVGPGKGDMFRNDMWSGMACSSVLEPMVLLYRRTGDRRYLDFCEWLVREWRRPGGPDIERKALAGTPVFQMFPGPARKIVKYGDNGHSKAYEMMSCFEGLVELYRATGNSEYLTAARKVHDDIQRTEITVIGSGSDWERWCDGAARQTETWQHGMETCVTVTWIKLSGQLLCALGDPKYADEMELAAYNALLGAQSPDGSWWCHYVTLTGNKEGAEGQCGLNENCCVANGPRALMLMPSLAVMTGSDGPVVNLYEQAAAQVTTPAGAKLKLAIESTYPAGSHVTIRVSGAGEPLGEFPLRLRIPAWSRETQVHVNGETVSAHAGSYLKLARDWKTGDVITLDFDFRMRVIRPPGATGQFALARGPIILAEDRRVAGTADAPRLALPGHDGTLAAAVGGKDSPAWLQFNVPTTDGRTVELCDYASAGNSWKPDSKFRLWFPSH